MWSTLIFAHLLYWAIPDKKTTTPIEGAGIPDFLQRHQYPLYTYKFQTYTRKNHGLQDYTIQIMNSKF